MNVFFSLILLVSFLILEWVIAERAPYRGLIFAAFVATLSVLLGPMLLLMAAILVCFNLLRFLGRELRLLALTSLSRRLKFRFDR